MIVSEPAFCCPAGQPVSARTDGCLSHRRHPAYDDDQTEQVELQRQAVPKSHLRPLADVPGTGHQRVAGRSVPSALLPGSWTERKNDSLGERYEAFQRGVRTPENATEMGKPLTCRRVGPKPGTSESRQPGIARNSVTGQALPIPTRFLESWLVLRDLRSVCGTLKRSGLCLLSTPRVRNLSSNAERGKDAVRPRRNDGTSTADTLKNLLAGRLSAGWSGNNGETVASGVVQQNTFKFTTKPMTDCSGRISLMLNYSVSIATRRNTRTNNYVLTNDRARASAFALGGN